ncbi:DUF3919 family protein [Paenibacillus silviterrae]|uniref:DUF3919 family protein n=1 Tax=Paenibacillus silviterrae TaxID=3242194 RepID=UPI002542ACFA|nr:DUF3919 family protein [Paenibacillus chinjuensis]
MTVEKKQLSWLRLIMMQVAAGIVIIGICAYMFRVPVDEVRVVSPMSGASDALSGVPMRVDVTYPGLGTLSIQDPKELLNMKSAFTELLREGRTQSIERSQRFKLKGLIVYLDQEDNTFEVGNNILRVNQSMVNSLSASADIRKLQSAFINKMLTPSMISEAVGRESNAIMALRSGKMEALSEAERAALALQIQASVKMIDFSHFREFTQKPDMNYVIQLSDPDSPSPHWIHLDFYNNGYMVVFDLLDETNQRAYFQLISTPTTF